MMGSKWLRTGGAILANTSKEEGEEKSDTEKSAEEIRKGVMLGRDKESSLKECGNTVGKIGKPSVVSNNQIMLLPQSEENQLINAENIIDGDCNEIMVTESKRRRVGLENSRPYTEMTGLSDEDSQNQKNGFLAGAALQARHSS